MIEKEEEFTMQIKKHENAIHNLTLKTDELQSENNNLKLSMSQSMRYLKRYEMKL